MPVFKTVFNGCAVKFSPFDERIAVATSQNFGIIGNGKQYVLQAGPNGLFPVAEFDTKDGIYDCAWSEENESILISSCGDGAIKVWNVQAPPEANPLRSFEEHGREVYSVNWNIVQRSLFLSGSWDDSIKLWDLQHPGSLQTFRDHTYCVYAAVWIVGSNLAGFARELCRNPAHANVFLSCSGDCTTKVWDIRQMRPTLTIAAHPAEVLCGDWCKYNDCVVVTGSVDKSLKTWDIRAPKQELTTLRGHTHLVLEEALVSLDLQDSFPLKYAVRKVLFSPHAESIIASCSYDMTVRLWDVAAPEDALLRVWDHHSEFVVGLDFSSLAEGTLASAGWDEQAFVWHQRHDPRGP